MELPLYVKSGSKNSLDLRAIIAFKPITPKIHSINRYNVKKSLDYMFTNVLVVRSILRAVAAGYCGK